MADKPKTRSDATNDLPDNTSGAISPQDVRRGVLSAFQMPGFTTVTAGDGGSGSRSDRATAVQNAIDRASNDSELVGVVVPDEYLNYAASSVTFDNSVRMVREGQQTDVYDVKAYGAAGDGSTDDADAFQAATDAAEAQSFSSIISIPAADFVLRPDVWTVSSGGMVVRGQGRDHSSLSLNAEGTLLVLSGVNEIVVERFRVTGGNNANDIGIDVQNGTTNRFHQTYSHLTIFDCPSAGINVQGSGGVDKTYWEKLRFIDAPLVWRGGGLGHEFVSCEWGDNDQQDRTLVDLGSVNRADFSACQFEASGHDTNGVHLHRVRNAVFTACQFENLDDTDASGDNWAVKIDDEVGGGAGTDRVRFEGCHFTTCDLAFILEGFGTGGSNYVRAVDCTFSGINTAVGDGGGFTDLLTADVRITIEGVTLDDFQNDVNQVFLPIDSLERIEYEIVRDLNNTGLNQKCAHVIGQNSDTNKTEVDLSEADGTLQVTHFALQQSNNVSEDHSLAVKRGRVNTGKDQSGWTIGDPAFLQNDGTIGNSAGTTSVQVGVIMDQANPGHVYFMGNVR